VRYYYNRYDKIHVIAYDKGQQHLQNISRLYSSLNSVDIIVVNNHSDCLKFLQQIDRQKILIIGHEDYREMLKSNPRLRFDKYFYDAAMVPFEEKWNSFYLERNLDKEKQIFHNVFHLTEDDKFIFLHEGKNIHSIQHNTSYKILNSSDYPEISIFDFLYTIEKATEVHVVNSAFLSLIDILKLRNNNIYYHKYVRPDEYEQPHLKLNWKIIE
jgi:hypothetical protein